MRFHIRLFLGVLLLGTALPTASYGQFQAPTKEELSMTSDPKAPGADAVYLFREEREDDPSHFRSVYARLKVLTEKGKEAATVHGMYKKNFVYQASGNGVSNSSSSTQNYFDAPTIAHSGQDQPWDLDIASGRIEIGSFQARTIHPDGTIVPLTGKPSELLHFSKDPKSANRVNFTFNMPAVEVGSILEFYYQVRYDRFLAPPEWQIQQPYFVHRAKYMFIPAVQFSPQRTLGGSGVSASQMKGKHDDIYTDLRASSILPPGKILAKDPAGNYALDLTDIPALPAEAFAPPATAQSYQSSFYYLYTPDEKEFWRKELQYWTKDLGPYIAPNPQLQQVVAEQVAGTDTPLEKAKKLYAFVQKLENTDLLGKDSTAFENDTVPKGSVDEVLQRKSGNSKEIAMLYLALVRAAGLSARPERIASRDYQIFSSAFMSTDQLDSILVGVTIDGKEIVLDPGEKAAPFQTLRWSHAGAGGVAFSPNGKIEIVVTPLQLNTDNTAIRVGTLTVGPGGELAGNLKVGFIGQQAMELRQLAIKAGPEAAKARVDELLAREVPEGIAAKVDHFSGLDNPNQQLVALVPINGALASHDPNRITLPRLFFQSKAVNPFPAEASRVLPVDMQFAAQEQEQITYNFPAGHTLETTPQDTKFALEEDAVYQLRSKVTPNSITTARILSRGFTLLDARQYDQLRDFYQKVLTADRQQIVLVAAKTTGN